MIVPWGGVCAPVRRGRAGSSATFLPLSGPAAELSALRSWGIEHIVSSVLKIRDKRKKNLLGFLFHRFLDEEDRRF